MKQLQCNLVQNPPIRIGDQLSNDGEWLSGLQRLIGGTLVDSEEKTDVRIAKTEDGRNHVYFNERTCRAALHVSSMDTERKRIVWYRLALLYVFAARMLHGERMVPMHGCLLKTGEHDGIFLCGQSGMGKTTTAQRWMEAGGQCTADDMILLEYGPDGILAHPLPTWSRCVESTSGEWNPFEEALSLKAILALSRDENAEVLRSIGDVPYMSSLYASCALFNLEMGKRMKKELQQRFIKSIQEGAQFLFEHFPHRGLFAKLNGDIRDTLGEFLESGR